MSLEGEKAIPLKGKALESYLEFQTAQQHKAAKEWSAAKKRGFGSQVVMHPAVWLPGKGKHDGFVSRGDKFERLAHEHELAAEEAEAAAAKAKLLVADSAPEHRNPTVRRSLSSLEPADQYFSANTAVSAVWGGLMPTDYRRGTPVIRPKSRGVLTLHALEQAAAAQTFPSTAFKAASWKAGRNGSGKEKMNQLFVPNTTLYGIGADNLYGGPMDRSGWNCGVPGQEMWSDKPGTLRDARGRNSELPARPEGWRSAVPAKFSKSVMLKQSRNPNVAGVSVSECWETECGCVYADAQVSYKCNAPTTDRYILPGSNDVNFQPPNNDMNTKAQLRRGEQLHRIESVRSGGPTRFFWTSSPPCLEKSWHTTIRY